MSILDLKTTFKYNFLQMIFQKLEGHNPKFLASLLDA